jgi:arylsulfatase A-like enzyme
VIFEGLEKAPDLGSAPGFFYFHLMSTHLAGVRQGQYSKYQPARVWTSYGEGDADTVSTTNYYDNGVIQADAVIKEIFETLERKGYLANSVVAIIADHGEGLGTPDHGIYGHVRYLYQEFIHIPFLIYDAEAEYANLEYSTQIDLAPTILDRLGLKIPGSWQGKSLLNPITRQYSFHQTRTYPSSHAVMYRTNNAIYKYIQHQGRGEELYEIMSDPRERRNLIGTADLVIINRLRAKLAENIRGDEPDYPARGQ